MSTPSNEIESSIVGDAAPEFEIGLVLAGAVSGGAYQAGVLDFLFEALERWEEEKQKDSDRFKSAVTDHQGFAWTAPQHRVRIRVVTGASAGSISAALMAMRAGWRYPWLSEEAVRRFADKQASLDQPVSPLFDAWVRQVDLTELLTLDDAPRVEQRVPSLLNGRALERIMRDVLAAPTPQSDQTASVEFLSEPLPMAFTACDLDGQEVSLSMNSGDAVVNHVLRSHSHRFRFKVHFCPPSAATQHDDWTRVAAKDLRASTMGQSRHAKPHALLEAALASSAFPIGLPARVVRRTRPTDLSDQSEAPRYVDGGVFDNEPIEPARALLWPKGKPTKYGSRANKALLLIDPFPDQPERWHDQQPGVLSTLMRLLTAWKNQARFQHADLKAAQDDSNFGMFLLAPSRGDDHSDRWQKARRLNVHVASAALGAFGGFLHREFRVHDYLLGRRNAQRFLADWFTLPADNPLFAQWPEQMRGRESLWKTDGRDGHELPVIPLIGDLHPRHDGQLPLPPWPVVRIHIEELRRRINDRVALVVNRELVFGAPIPFLDVIWRFAQRLLLVALKSHVARAIVRRVVSELDKLGLLQKPIDESKQSD